MRWNAALVGAPMHLPYIDSFEKLLIFILTLSLLVVVHEGGHFWVARWNGVAVTEFAVGFGPAIASIRSKRSGTRYRLNIIPLGGYCAMLGEDARRETIDDPIGVSGVDYSMRAPWQRLAIVVAGPFVNLAASFVILLCSALIIGVPGDQTSTKIGKLVAGYPAERAGLKAGDRITAIDHVQMLDGATMVHKINASLGKSITLTYLRDGVTRDVALRPVPTVRNGHRIGVTGFMPISEYQHLSPFKAMTESWHEFSLMLTTTVSGLRDLVMHTSKEGYEVVGPIGMARAAVAIEDFGPGAFIWFASFISLSLGIFNLLPIPALDGGRLVFIVVELLRGRPVDPEKEALVHLTGFAALIAFVVFRSYHDIINMIAGKSAI